MRRRPYQAGDLHWTRQPGVVRTPWAKLKPHKRDELIARYEAGESQGDLALAYQIGRTTVWRYLKARHMIDA